MQSYHSDSDRESPTRPYSSSMPAHMNAVPLKLLLPQRHVIDDDREGSLVIDEKKLKKPAKVRPHNNQQQRGPIKLRLSGEYFITKNPSNLIEIPGNPQIFLKHPKIIVRNAETSVRSLNYRWKSLNFPKKIARIWMKSLEMPKNL